MWRRRLLKYKVHPLKRKTLNFRYLIITIDRRKSIRLKKGVSESNRHILGQKPRYTPPPPLEVLVGVDPAYLSQTSLYDLRQLEIISGFFMVYNLLLILSFCALSEVTPCTLPPHPCNNNGNCIAIVANETTRCECFKGWRGDNCSSGKSKMKSTHIW